MHWLDMRTNCCLLLNSCNFSLMRLQIAIAFYWQHMLRSLFVPESHSTWNALCACLVYNGFFGVRYVLNISTSVCVRSHVCASRRPESIRVWSDSCATNQSPFTGDRVIKACSSHTTQCTWSTLYTPVTLITHSTGNTYTQLHTVTHTLRCTYKKQSLAKQSQVCQLKWV